MQGSSSAKASPHALWSGLNDCSKGSCGSTGCGTSSCGSHNHARPTVATQALGPSSPSRATLQPTSASFIDEAATAAISQHPSDRPASPPRPAAASGYKKTFYKRKLPSPPAIEFASPEGRQLFQEALADGKMTGFFKLMEQFSTQDEPAFCGLASLAMVLNALSIDPRRTWKGAWRWFHEAMLDCCRPLEVVKAEGITLGQAACLARCNGAKVELEPYGSFTLEQFRQEVSECCKSGEEHIIVSYSRKAFGQTGDGHFSPIGGYHAARDLVLVLDVARFKYPPHWVPLEGLYRAMAYIDPETNRPRGYMRLASHPLLDSVLFTLDVRSSQFQASLDFIRKGAVEAVRNVARTSGRDSSSSGSTSNGTTGTPGDGSRSPGTAAALPAVGSSSAGVVSVSGGGVDAVRALVDHIPLDSLATFMIVRSGIPVLMGHNCAPAHPPTPPTPPSVTSASAAVSAPSSATSEQEVAAAGAAAATAERCVPTAQRQQLLDELRAMPLYQVVVSALAERRQREQQQQQQAAAAAGPAVITTSHTSTTTTTVITATTSMSATDTTTTTFTTTNLPTETSFEAQQPEEPQQAQLHRDASSGPCDMRTDGSGISSSSTATAADADAVASSSGAQECDYCAERITLLLLMQPQNEWPEPEEWKDPAAFNQWHGLLDTTFFSIVAAEAAYLREQLKHIDEVLLRFSEPSASSEGGTADSGDSSSVGGDNSGSSTCTTAVHRTKRTVAIVHNCPEHAHPLDCAAHGHY